MTTTMSEYLIRSRVNLFDPSTGNFFASGFVNTSSADPPISEIHSLVFFFKNKLGDFRGNKAYWSPSISDVVQLLDISTSFYYNLPEHKYFKLSPKLQAELISLDNFIICSELLRLQRYYHRDHCYCLEDLWTSKDITMQYKGIGNHDNFVA